MVAGLCYVIAISCSQPRLDFVSFYKQACMSPYPGLPYEMKATVERRIAEGVASYVDYVESYRDECKPNERR